MTEDTKDRIESHLEDFGWNIFTSIDAHLIRAVSEEEDVTDDEAVELIEEYYREWVGGVDEGVDERDDWFFDEDDDE